ncbi:MAG: hypothetical protein NZ551_05555 [Microscillaceae bacterium]|nr:hypothetical protein [Microscillaceae bacterium]MDW8460662.1 hypothetical protein [Cytophagales bacterium]
MKKYFNQILFLCIFACVGFATLENTTLFELKSKKAKTERTENTSEEEETEKTEELSTLQKTKKRAKANGGEPPIYFVSAESIAIRPVIFVLFYFKTIGKVLYSLLCLAPLYLLFHNLKVACC